MNFFASTYTFTPDQDSEGISTIRAEITDGEYIVGVNWTINVSDYIPPSEPHMFQMEVGNLNIDNTIDYSGVVSLEFVETYNDPIVVAYVYSCHETESVEVRIDNVTAYGCDVFMEEPDNGNHTAELISYMVVEAGEWVLSDGTEIKAGILTTDKNHHGPSPYTAWETVSFYSSFGSIPVILHSLNTYNNNAFKTSIVDDVRPASFKIQQESAETGTPTKNETIGWIAIESGIISSINVIPYETILENDGDNDGVDDDGHKFSYYDFSLLL